MPHVKINDALFPVPERQSFRNPGQNPLAPLVWPGVTAKSTETLRQDLTDNWNKHHIFFNERGFHNHIVHAILSLWSLGAPPATIEASYTQAASYQRALIEPSNVITHDNWRNHLGDERYFRAYRDYFCSQLQSGATTTALLEKYIFASNANFVPGMSNQPEMLGRTMEAIVHSLIHIGLGVEFGLPGVVAEGLAQAACHRSSSTAIIPPEWFSTSASVSASRGGVHALTVLARVMNDPELESKIFPKDFGFYIDVMNLQGNAIRRHVEAWSLEGDLQKKVEEIVWLNTLIYAVAGSDKHGGEFNADFFLMHLVTSSLFLPTIFSILNRNAQILLLRSYLSISIAWYVARGRPHLNIRQFFTNPHTLHPSAPGPHPTPHHDALPSSTSPDAVTPSPWLQIIQSALTNPDDHLIKIQRTLATWDGYLGGTKKGAFGGGVTELEGAEEIDGTLWLRTAGLTMGRLGWVREGQAAYETVYKTLWDRRGFYPNGQIARL